MRIRPYTKYDHKAMQAVARKLPSWFTKKATEQHMPLDFKFQHGFVAVESGKIIGFISVYSYEGEPQIGWIAVLPELHGKGIGKRLLIAAELALKKSGAKTLKVETVGRCEPPDKGYADTVKFYRRMGFRTYKKGEIHTHGKWKYQMYTFRKKL